MGVTWWMDVDGGIGGDEDMLRFLEILKS